MSKFDQVIQSELSKGQVRHGTAFNRQSIEARGERVSDCILKELAGVWLYASLGRGGTGFLLRMMVRLSDISGFQ